MGRIRRLAATSAALPANGNWRGSGGNGEVRLLYVTDTSGLMSTVFFHGCRPASG